jgi:2Fe-2S ferredoxin
LFERLPEASEEETDVLYGLAEYKDKCTRMACQIKITKELDGMVVRVPRKQTVTRIG